MIRKQPTIFAVCTLAIVLLGAAGLLLIQRRQASCASVPLLNGELLPNAALVAGSDPKLPAGWARGANGVELRSAADGFEYDGDDRALQLLGIGNMVQTPAVPVQPGRSYCFVGKALTDSVKGSATRVQVSFAWRDARGQLLGEDQSDWQPVVLWQKAAPPSDWSTVRGAFIAPASAATLLVTLRPASDDRVYLDAMHVRQGGTAAASRALAGRAAQSSIVIQPWPHGYHAALSFSFDWETTMGGLIHTRSDDPVVSTDPVTRGLRMREGITTTLELFRPHRIRATYYATGYNFLLGNTEKQQFMGNPIFSWADHTTSGKWPSDHWTSTPWFANDPYGTFQSEPAWYFGDLIAPLQAEKQDLQSHTFSHFDGGLASTQQWRDDIAAWRAVAATRGVPMARSLAFPWSSSAGLSDTDWDTLEAASITSVTRTKPGQPQYQLANADDGHCRPVPGHQRILACPDFYLHNQASATQALKLIDHTIAVSGTIDLWAHTEEVTAPEQIAAWAQVVDYAARQRDAGTLWIAPLAEIADWQQALGSVRVQGAAVGGQGITFQITNGSPHDLQGLTLRLPFAIARYTVNNQERKTQNAKLITLDIAAGQTLEVQAWPV